MTPAALEALAEALGKYDAVVRACPANKTHLGDKLCPECGAGPSEGCRAENRAAYAFIEHARAAILRQEQGK